MLPAAAQQEQEQQPAVIHLQILHRKHHAVTSSKSKGSNGSNDCSSSYCSSSKTIETSSSQLDLARLEEQHAVKVLKLLTRRDNEGPSEDEYEESVTQVRRVTMLYEIGVLAVLRECCQTNGGIKAGAYLCCRCCSFRLATMYGSLLKAQVGMG
jgi:hypothetical protein